MSLNHRYISLEGLNKSEIPDFEFDEIWFRRFKKNEILNFEFDEIRIIKRRICNPYCGYGIGYSLVAAAGGGPLR